MIILGRGHPNITAKHKTTIAFTKDPEISVRGDCFVAVDCKWEVTPEFLNKLKHAEKVTVVIECEEHKETITGKGTTELTISHKELVIRKSDWVDSKTLMVGADKSARDLSKEVVQCLKKPTPVNIKVII